VRARFQVASACAAIYEMAMTARDLFGVFLRLGAGWLLVWGCWQLVAAVVYIPATVKAVITQGQLSYGSIAYAAYGLPAVGASVLVLRFADAIVNFTYRR
jgi:hypothetical protein